MRRIVCQILRLRADAGVPVIPAEDEQFREGRAERVRQLWIFYIGPIDPARRSLVRGEEALKLGLARDQSAYESQCAYSTRGRPVQRGAQQPLRKRGRPRRRRRRSHGPRVERELECAEEEVRRRGRASRAARCGGRRGRRRSFDVGCQAQRQNDGIELADKLVQIEVECFACGDGKIRTDGGRASVQSAGMAMDANTTLAHRAERWGGGRGCQVRTLACQQFERGHDAF